MEKYEVFKGMCVAVLLLFVLAKELTYGLRLMGYDSKF